MNPQEAMNLLRQLLTLGGGILTGLGVVTAGQASTITYDLGVAVPALISFGSVCWSVYVHWNMKKVPDKSTAIVLPGEPSLPVGTNLDLTPLRGKAEVVG